MHGWRSGALLGDRFVVSVVFCAAFLLVFWACSLQSIHGTAPLWLPMWLYFCQRVPMCLTALPMHPGSPAVMKNELASDSHVSRAWERGHSS